MASKPVSSLSPGRRSDPSSSLTYRTSTGRNHDNFAGDGRRLHNSGSATLLSTFNGGGSSFSVDGGNSLVVPLPSSSAAHTPSAGGAVSMPSSPRLGRRSGNHEQAASRTRKYSAGSLSGMIGGCHSRSLPRLCTSPAPRENNNGDTALSTLPPRRSDVGGYRFNKDFYNNNYQDEGPNFNHNTGSSSRNQNQPSTQGEGVVSICLSSPKTLSSTGLPVSPTSSPPDVTISSKSGGSSSPRVAKKLSLTSSISVHSTSSSPSELDQLNCQGLSSEMELYLGDREKRGAELNGALGLELTERTGHGPAVGLGERRQSFGKAGMTQPVGLRERRGSISSLSGKEELTDYHQRQKEERLREQEVERLVSSILQESVLTLIFPQLLV